MSICIFILFISSVGNQIISDFSSLNFDMFQLQIYTMIFPLQFVPKDHWKYSLIITICVYFIWWYISWYRLYAVYPPNIFTSIDQKYVNKKREFVLSWSISLLIGLNWVNKTKSNSKNVYNLFMLTDFYLNGQADILNWTEGKWLHTKSVSWWN